MTETQDLKDLLEDRYQRYNQPSFIESDPIWIPPPIPQKGRHRNFGFSHGPDCLGATQQHPRQCPFSHGAYGPCAI